jgi:hypothetical protein
VKYQEITKSNSFLEVSNRYCQLLLEETYLPYLESGGSLTGKWLNWGQDLSKASTAVSEVENTKRNFEIVERVGERLCDNLGRADEERGWTFDNLIAISSRLHSSYEHSRFEINLLKKISNRMLMHYLKAASSKFRLHGEYPETDVNLYRDILIDLLTMTDISTDSSSVSWFVGLARTPRNFLFDDSTLEWGQEALGKPWREIYQTYLEILSELRTMPAIHLEKLSQIPSEVLYFCYQQQILPYVPVAMDVIERSFLTTITELKTVPEKDSETGEEWLELKIKIKGEVKEVLDTYDKYTDLLVSSLPWSVRYKMRLSYKIV